MHLLTEHPTTHFAAPGGSVAPAPAEHRGVARDGVRLLVARPGDLVHTTFRHLAEHFGAGDVVVVNNSQTVAAAWDARSDVHGPIVVHAVTPLDDGTWVVEMRMAPDAARAVLDGRPGERLTSGDLEVVLRTAYPHDGSSPTGAGNRLWRASVAPSPGDLAAYLLRHGRPIAYGYLDRRYPLTDYQTVFGTHPGSAEMPSAARPFTPAIVIELVSRGVAVAPITLHTGVSSQEAGEAPLAERFEVTASTARLVNAARAGGGRVVAVGTTVTRALESAVDDDGALVARSGWTDRVVTPADPPRVVTGLVTGWHDPQASHLLLVEAVAGTELTQRAYDAAVTGGYLWHEFGDAAVLLPDLPHLSGLSDSE